MTWRPKVARTVNVGGICILRIAMYLLRTSQGTFKLHSLHTPISQPSRVLFQSTREAFSVANGRFHLCQDINRHSYNPSNQAPRSMLSSGFLCNEVLFSRASERIGQRGFFSRPERHTAECGGIQRHSEKSTIPIWRRSWACQYRLWKTIFRRHEYFMYLDHIRPQVAGRIDKVLVKGSRYFGLELHLYYELGFSNSNDSLYAHCLRLQWIRAVRSQIRVANHQLKSLFPRPVLCENVGVYNSKHLEKTPFQSKVWLRLIDGLSIDKYTPFNR